MAGIGDLSSLLNSAATQPPYYPTMPPAPQPPAAQAPVPQAPPSGANGGFAPFAPLGSLPSAQVLARLKSNQQSVRTPNVFSGVPDVKGLDRGSAFLSGLSGGLADQSKGEQVAAAAQQQQQAQNLQMYKTLFDVEHQTREEAETAREHSIMEAHYKATEENAKKEEPADRVEKLQKNAPTLVGTPAGQHYVLTGELPKGFGDIKEKKLTPYEEKSITDSDEQLANLQNAKAAFERNFQFDPKTGQELPTSPNQKVPGGFGAQTRVNAARIGVPFTGGEDMTNAATQLQSDMTTTAAPLIRKWMGARAAWAADKAVFNTFPTLDQSASDRAALAKAQMSKIDSMLQHEIKRNAGLRNGTYFTKEGGDPDLMARPGAVPPGAPPSGQQQPGQAQPPGAVPPQQQAPQHNPNDPKDVAETDAASLKALQNGTPLEKINEVRVKNGYKPLSSGASAQL